MKITVSITDTLNELVNEALLKKTAQTVIAKEAQGFKSEIEVSIAVISSEEIRQINRQYRQIDSPTDVLSFTEVEFLDRKKNRCLRNEEFIGEILLCLEVIQKDAKESNVSFNYELAWALIHGILHLFGYDHELNQARAQKMREKEAQYLSKLKF